MHPAPLCGSVSKWRVQLLKLADKDLKKYKVRVRVGDGNRNTTAKVLMPCSRRGLT